MVKYLPITPTVLLVCTRSLLWPCVSVSCSSQVLSASLKLLHHYPSASSESPRRNLRAQVLYKSNRLLHLRQPWCRQQEHLWVIGAHLLASCLWSHSCPLQLPPSPSCLWLLCKYKVPFPSRLDLTWEGLPKVGFYLCFCPPPSAGVSGLQREQHLLPPASSAGPRCDTEPRLCPSPGHQHHLHRLRARTPWGCNASLG